MQNGSNMPHSEENQRTRKKKGVYLPVQQIISIGAFLIAGVLLVACIIMIFQAAFAGGGNKKPNKPSSIPASSSADISTSIGGAVPPPASGEESSSPTIDASSWNLLLINSANPVQEGFTQPELAEITTGYTGTYYFDARAVEQLRKMIDDCNAVSGNDLMMNAGFRTYYTQNNDYNYWYNSYINQGASSDQAAAQAAQIVQPAGTADAHTGLGASFAKEGVDNNSTAFDQTAEFKWLEENAQNYGFVLRFPQGKEGITGFKYAPYYWRYVGVDEAKVMKDSNLTLEEYLGQA